MSLSIAPARLIRARQAATKALIALSLGNLFFVRRWYDVMRLESRSVDYYRTGHEDPTLLLATAASALLAGLVLWLLWRWAERQSPVVQSLAKSIFLAFLIFPVETIRRYWNTEYNHVDLVSNAALILVEGFLLAGVVLLWRGNLRILRAARRTALVATLFLPGLIFDLCLNYAAAPPNTTFAPQASLPMLPSDPHKPRVVWMVFDELDQRMAFETRPANLQLPELDRLRSESLVADHAQETANWTVLALPSLIAGRVFDHASLIDASTLKVTPENSQQKLVWGEQPNVFQAARAQGVNAELVGWHHPYCRMIGGELVRCFDQPNGHPTAALLRETHATEQGVWKTVAFLYRLQVESLKDLFRSDITTAAENLKTDYLQHRQQRQYLAIRDHAYESAVDPRIGLLFVHFPAPHLYPVYNRRKQSFTLDGTEDYFDNLALVDRTVGEMRRTLERAGLLDQTTLIVTSDHGFRPDAWRNRYSWTSELAKLTADGGSTTVPLIVRLPKPGGAAKYEKPTTNLFTGELSLAILRGQVATAEQAARWIEQRSSHMALTQVSKNESADID